MPIDETDENERKRELICMVGQLVFGAPWPKPMAFYLNISKRHMSRWAEQRYAIPDMLPNGERLIAALRLLLVEHKNDVDAALAKLPIMKDKAK